MLGTITWAEIWQGVTIGVAATAAWFVLQGLLDLGKDLIVYQWMKKSLRKSSIASHERHLGFIVHNDTWWPVSVRKVVLNFSPGSMMPPSNPIIPHSDTVETGVGLYPSDPETNFDPDGKAMRSGFAWTMPLTICPGCDQFFGVWLSRDEFTSKSRICGGELVIDAKFLGATIKRTIKLTEQHIEMLNQFWKTANGV